MNLNVPVSPGEFLDKLSILEIKSERMSDAAKLKNVRNELSLLRRVWSGSAYANKDIEEEYQQLRSVNEQLWDIEDRIRLKEADKDFGQDFIDLARSVYILNDRRAASKRRLNEALGSDLIEEKSYADYGAPGNVPGGSS